MIEKSDFRVDWDNEAIEISQKIKGLYPRANTTFRGKNLKLNLRDIHRQMALTVVLIAFC